jgi:hypothetical protein
MVRYSLSNVYFRMTPMWNTDLLESVGKIFVMEEPLADRQFTIWWINLKQQESLIDKKQKALSAEKIDDIGARLKHTPRKSLKRLAQETGVSMCSVRTVTKLLKIAIDILFRWSMFSLAGIHIYTKQSLLEFTDSTSNPGSPASSSETWCLVCCKCKNDCCTCVF